jgi:[ribosomal protein S18]-alanine N-acetyltransferase
LGITITEAAIGDADWLAAIHAEALPPGWPASDFEAYCRALNRIVLKAEDLTGIQGFAVLQVAADEAEILTVAVAKQMRRKAIASCILQKAVALCQEKSISCIYLEVAAGNAPAIELYRKLGFCVIAQRKDYYSTARSAPETALIMRLDINPEVKRVDPHRGRT